MWMNTEGVYAMDELAEPSENEAPIAGSEAALALIRAIVIGDDAAKASAYKRLQTVWKQKDIDNLTIDMEALFRAYAG